MKIPCQVIVKLKIFTLVLVSGGSFFNLHTHASLNGSFVALSGMSFKTTIRSVLLPVESIK